MRVGGVVKGDYSRFTQSDLDGIKPACPAIRYVTPQLWLWGHAMQYESQSCNGNELGVSPDFLPMHNRSVLLGRSFSDFDVDQANRVCVLGTKAVDELFGNRDPIGREVRVRGVGFTVLGVLKPAGQNGGWFDDADKMMLMPYTTVQRYLRHQRRFSSVRVAAWAPDSVPTAKEQVIAFIRQQHTIRANGRDDFGVYDVEAMLANWRHQQDLFAGLLGGVASISLLVGGIGIMNIMLVTVTDASGRSGSAWRWGAPAVRHPHPVFHRGAQHQPGGRPAGDCPGALYLAPDGPEVGGGHRERGQHHPGLRRVNRHRGILRLLSRAESVAAGSDRGAAP